jgi:hypothetical protein
MEIVGSSGFRQRIGTAITPAVIDQCRAARSREYFFREAAPLTDAAQSFVEKYKHRPIVCFVPWSDEFGRKAVFRRVDVKPVSRNGQSDLPPACARKTGNMRNKWANKQYSNGGTHGHYKIIFYFRDEA